MCLEIYDHFRCGCIEFKEKSLCPYLEEVKHLINNCGIRGDDQRMDRLYEQCDYVAAKRYLAQKTKCERCLVEVAATAAEKGGDENLLGIGTWSGKANVNG